jgi:hypothetical protein
LTRIKAGNGKGGPHFNTPAKDDRRNVNDDYWAAFLISSEIFRVYLVQKMHIALGRLERNKALQKDRKWVLLCDKRSKIRGEVIE